MILSFSAFKEKIEDGTKTQTIRRYSEFQYKRFCHAKMYQLYWGNPRNGGTLIKEVEPAELPRIIRFMQLDHFVGKENRFHQIMNAILDEQSAGFIPLFPLAKADRFDDDFQMWDWFKGNYGENMFTKKFMVLRWKP